LLANISNPWACMLSVLRKLHGVCYGYPTAHKTTSAVKIGRVERT
jgi:hypothetical protein